MRRTLPRHHRNAHAGKRRARTRDIYGGYRRETQEEKRFAVGDLVRGSGEIVPETSRDCVADLYRVRTVHCLARASDQNQVRELDPPRHRRAANAARYRRRTAPSTCPRETATGRFLRFLPLWNHGRARAPVRPTGYAARDLVAGGGVLGTR